jgi:hypothetical protein
MGKIPDVTLPPFTSDGRKWTVIEELTGDGTGMWVYAVEYRRKDPMPLHLVWVDEYPPRDASPA